MPIYTIIIIVSQCKYDNIFRIYKLFNKIFYYIDAYFLNIFIK